MAVIRHHPMAPLDTYVQCFWWSRRDQPDMSCEHMLPGGGAQLVFALHDAPILSIPGSSSAGAVSWSRGVVHGPQWHYYRAGPKPAGAVAGVSFHPGRAGTVLGVPITEFTDRHVPIDALWGQRGHALYERLLAAQDPAAVFRILETELTARIQHPLLIHPAVAYSLACPSTPWSPLRVSDVHREAGYSAKHFIALFRSAVGLTPKHFYRIQRFTSVLRHLAGGNPPHLAELAAAAGYSDQSHLNREFRAFAGITPTQYRPRNQDSVLHHRVQNPLPGLATPGKKNSRRG